MCGLCGAVGFEVDAVRDSMAHRGPDDARSWRDPDCAFGFRRLSIIDPDGGAQPMESPRAVLMLNGEIYNHRELGRGLPLKSRSDAEPVLHLFANEGPAVFRRLRGMFAIAIWDRAEKALFLARDPVGKKPLVYWHDGPRFAFASELQALMRFGIPRDVDRAAVDSYVQAGVIAPPLTIYRGVRKLPPGHWLKFKAGRVEVVDYREAVEATGTVRDAVADAIHVRLEADVPVGAFLSGGLDSAIVVSQLAKRGPLKTFSIGFDDPEIDESAAAAEVARHFKTEHESRTFQPGSAAPLERLVRHFGEPFADPSALPMFELAKLASQHVKVAFSGDGGDECFAGYLRHRAIRLLANVKRLPKPLRWAVRLAPVDRRYKTRLRDLIDGIDRPLGSLYGEFVAPFDPATRRALGVADHPALPFDDRDPVSSACQIDSLHYLPDDLLAKTDATSMAFGLEVRCPLTDPRVAAVASAIPGPRRLGKAPLRDAFRDVLPASVLKGRKRGFGIPLDAWLRGPWKPQRDDLIGKVAGRLIREHDQGKDHGRALWALMVFVAWGRAFGVDSTDILVERNDRTH